MFGNDALFFFIWFYGFFFNFFSTHNFFKSLFDKAGKAHESDS